ncbi:MAG TPA: response regulator [Thermoanaerobaculia bacterium]|nr:response regulator [Thermoanaerobaculia bacterium]
MSGDSTRRTNGASPPLRQHLRVLLVEDNEFDAQLIERELRRGGLDCSIHRVEEEAAFRTALEQSDPDVILADYNLPDFDGIAALKIARRLLPETPFILVSGLMGEERATQALREGAVDYIAKDRLRRLPAAVTRAIEERREKTLRMRAQDELRRSEERFKFAAIATQEVIWDWNLETDQLWFSDALAAVWGYSLPEHEVDSSWWEARIHPEDRERVVSSLRIALDAGERWSGEYRFERADGSYGYVNTRAVIIRDHYERPVRVICAMLDRTEQHDAEQALRQSEENFRAVAERSAALSRQNETILRFAAEAIIFTNTEGRPIFVNPAAEQLTGYAAEELMRERVHNLLHHSRPDASPYPADDCPIGNALRNAELLHGEDVFWNRAGEPFAVAFNLAPTHEAGRVTGSVLSFQDITDRKRLQKELEQANRVISLGRVAATMAHEFNNVLMGIQPFAELIARRTPEDERTAKAAAQILAAVSRGRRVTQEILRFTQPAEPAFETTDVGGWLQHVMPELRALAANGPEIALEIPAAPAYARFDKSLMHQVITNLVLNARDATPSHGRVLISVQCRDARGSGGSKQVILSVRDNGSGIPEKILRQVFDPLFTTKRNGTGLGLAIALQIVTRMGGSIDVESTVGKGTVFQVCFPAVEKSDLRLVPPQAHPRRALIVEDDESVAAGVSAALEMEGFETRVAGRGNEVLPAIDQYQPDVVLLDVTLPDRSGSELYHDISRHSPHLPVIFSTGVADTATLENMPRDVAVLHKPYDIGVLLRAIEAALSRIANAGVA